MLIVIPLLVALTGEPAPPASKDAFDVALDLLRLQRIRMKEVSAVSDLRSAVSDRLASPPAKSAEAPGGYRRRCDGAAGRVACTTVPETPGETGQHGFCSDSASSRICYTEDGSEPRMRAGRCLAPCRELPEDWVATILPEPRLSTAEKAALAAALEADPRLRDQPGLKETFRALVAAAPSTDAPPPAPGRAHAGAVNAVAFTPDGNALITSSAEGERATLWSVASRAPLGVFADCGAYKVLVTPDGGTAVTSCFGGVKLWALPEGTLRTSLGGYDTGMIDLAIDAAGRTLAGGAKGTITVWTLPGPRHLTTFKTVGPGEFVMGTFVALTPDGKTLVSAGFGQRMQVWAVAAGAQPVTLDASEPTDVTDLAVSPDGATLAAGYGNGTVRLWSLKERREIANRHEHGFPVNGLEFSADGRWLVSASSDQTVKVWALPEATVRHTLRGHANEVFAVAVSKTGLIASADRDGVVRLWDLVSGADKGTLVDPALR